MIQLEVIQWLGQLSHPPASLQVLLQLLSKQPQPSEESPRARDRSSKGKTREKTPRTWGSATNPEGFGTPDGSPKPPNRRAYRDYGLEPWRSGPFRYGLASCASHP